MPGTFYYGHARPRTANTTGSSPWALLFLRCRLAQSLRALATTRFEALYGGLGFARYERSQVLCQGTTLVGPQATANTTGFSPWGLTFPAMPSDTKP